MVSNSPQVPHVDTFWRTKAAYHMFSEMPLMEMMVVDFLLLCTSWFWKEGHQHWFVGMKGWVSCGFYLEFCNWLFYELNGKIALETTATKSLSLRLWLSKYCSCTHSEAVLKILFFLCTFLKQEVFVHFCHFCPQWIPLTSGFIQTSVLVLKLFMVSKY